MQTQEYLIATTGGSYERLEQIVKDLLGKGWRVSGGVSHSPAYDTRDGQEWTLAQALVRDVPVTTQVNLLTFTTAHDFEKDIENHLRDGWQLQGSPFQKLDNSTGFTSTHVLVSRQVSSSVGNY